jgi:hypothetical protein
VPKKTKPRIAGLDHVGISQEGEDDPDREQGGRGLYRKKQLVEYLGQYGVLYSIKPLREE